MNDFNAASERVRALIAEHFHIEVLEADTDLLDSGILDSMQFVELFAYLEEEFGLRIPIEEVELDDLRTPERLARLVSVDGASRAASTGH